MKHRSLLAGVVAIAAALPAALVLDETGSLAATSGRAPRPSTIVLNGEGNNLNALATRAPFRKQVVIRNREADPSGLDINAQICVFPGGRRFIAGEDTGQPDPVQGWGIFELRGTRVGRLRARQVGKLQPSYQGSADNAENYGCGVLSDGRVVTTDIGNQATGDGDGQLIVWFPPFTAGFETVAKGSNGRVRFCKVDVAIATAGGIAVDDEDRVYVASARPPTSGVWRYAALPTSDDAAGGCGRRDVTGAPLADAVTKAPFVAVGNGLATPNAIVRSSRGTWYVSSVFTGVINEYDDAGTFVRTVLAPTAGEQLGAKPFSTGTPLGLGVGPDGTLYYADIGIVVGPDGIGPGPEGTVRRVRFVGGEPQAPEVMAAGLAFPDGIGIYVPGARRAAAGR